MRHTLLLLILVVAAISFSCSHSKKLYHDDNENQEYKTTDTGVPGSSFENAIIIKETSEMKGVSAEYEWLDKNYPGYVSEGQALLYNNSRPYDKINIKTKDGKHISVYFDISNFFGKW